MTSGGKMAKIKLKETSFVRGQRFKGKTQQHETKSRTISRKSDNGK
jgi:hypothetical protein